MFEKIARHVFCFTVFIIINTCATVEEYIVNQQYYDSLGFTGSKPSFSKKVYTANIDGISIELTEPVILENCLSIDTNFEMDMSGTKYLAVRDDKASALGNNCTLLFPKIFIKNKGFEEQAFTGFITIKAIHQNYVLDITSVVLLRRSNTKDIKIIFEVDGTEYIIVNYFYLKVTFILIISIIALILAVEIKEIHRKYTKNKYKQIVTSI